MWGTTAPIDTTSVSYVFHQHDTVQGHSGGPIYDFNNGVRQLLAIHKGPFTDSANAGIKFRKRVFDFVETARGSWPSSFCDW